MRQQPDPTREAGRDRLGDEKQPPPVEAVGRAAGPGREHEDRDELAEVEHPEHQSRMRLAVDEHRRREVLEPGSARRERVADEVGPERPLAQKRDDRRRPDERTQARPALCSCA